MIEQILIFIFSCSSIWFLSRPEKWKRCGYLIGILGQPFWIKTSIENKQYGILFVSIFFCYSYAQGIWYFWIKETIDAKKQI